MKSLQRQVGIIILLALITSVGFTSAQENTIVTVVGSGIVVPVLQSVATESGAPVILDATVTGTNRGFEMFCQGEANITTSTRTITAAEDSQCTQNGVAYTELLIGHNILAFIAKPDSTYTQCLTSANLSAIFPPSAQGQITNWQQISPENADTPLSVFVPASDTADYGVLDNLIPGDGIRADAVAQADDATIAAVSADAGAIGVVSLKSAIAAGDTVKILELSTNDVVGCAVPSVENVEALAYTAAEELFVYVSNTSLEKAGLKDMLTFVSSDQAATGIDGLGFSPSSANIYATNLASLEGTGETRPFSSTTTAFQIPLDVAGPVNVAGATTGRTYLSDAATAFQSLYSQVTVDVKTLGQPAGIRRLCNGEIDIAIVDSDITVEQTQNCDANNITTFPIDLGKQAVVLVGNANSSQLACLTNAQLKTAWEAVARETVTNWNQVDSSFPDQTMTLFAPNLGNSATDLLMIKAAGTDLPARDDSEFNDDPLYRAAATANVEGGLTYMTWAEYQQVLANNQERIQLVSVDGGNGCIAPSEATIADGSYPLTQSAKLLVNRNSLTNVPVQSFLWYLASDENYGLLESSGLIGVSFGSLRTLRDALQKAYLDAAQTAAEATPEPIAEATSETTSEPVVEPTVEATAEEPVVEATTEVTVEATAEATPSS
jgi:phosphate transport system substrate-binding protein